MSRQLVSWYSMIPEAELADLAREAMQHAAQNLSQMVNHTIDIVAPELETVPLARITSYAGDPETQMVGVYLLIEGDLCGQAMLMLPVTSALKLIDLLMNAPVGTTTELEDLGRSALAEVGNLTLSSFLNAIVARTGMDLKPSPPAVMVDMLGAMMNVIIATVAAVADDLLIVKTNFVDSDRAVEARFWVLPDPEMQFEQPQAAEARYGG